MAVGSTRASAPRPRHAYQDTASPFSDDNTSATPARAPFRNDSMRQALEDVVVYNNKPSGPTRSTTSESLATSEDYNDILASYGNDRSTNNSPVKERRAAPNRDRSPSTSPVRERPRQQRKESSGYLKDSSEESLGKSGKKAKEHVGLDVIDRLDISGLYGGGGLIRHDGPFAAATAARNKGPRAPMAAFDPSALAPPASKPSKPNSNLSARAQATLAAMDDVDGGAMGAGADGPYGGVGRSTAPSQISMGFPSDHAKGKKGQQLVEIYGVRDNEAWQDFGTSRYDQSHSGSNTHSRESILPPGVSKEERAGRAQSIWDIEATLQAGRPVGQAAPPPVPVLPSEFHSGASDAKPKRSKSLAARFRSGKRNPNTPMGEGSDDDEKDGDALSPLPDRSPELQQQRSVPLSVRDENGRFRAPADQTGAGGSPFDHESARYDDGSRLGQSKSYGSAPESNPETLGRRPSVMQRLFNKKKSNTP